MQGLLLGQVRGFCGEVGVLYTALCSSGVFHDVLQVGDGAGQTVLRSTQVCAGGVDRCQSSVDRGDRVVDVGRQGSGSCTSQNNSTAAYGQGYGVELGAQYQVDAVSRTSVGANLQLHGTSGTVQQVFAVQIGGSRDTSDLVRHLSEFGVGSGLVSSAVGAVTCFNSQFTHTLQNVGRSLQRAFSGLGNGDTVVGVLHCLIATTNLRSHASCDLQASGVVFSAVDFQAGRQASHRSRQSVGSTVQVFLNVQRRGVGVYC
ncbi:hypothetical protein D9M69_545200 [compost metagenome]